MGKAGSLLALGVVSLAGLSAAFLARGDDAVAPIKSAHDAARTPLAGKLVRDALAAELAGDNARRDKLLADALKLDPNCRAARWQSGFVLIDGKWMTPQAAAQKYAHDPVLAEYARRRDEFFDAVSNSGGPVALTANTTSDAALARGQVASRETFRSEGLSPAAIRANVALARWCHANRLFDEERAHWTQVLMSDPANREAQARLALRPFMGQLYTGGQIDAIKQQLAVEQRERDQWQSKVRGWRRAIDDGAASEQYQAIAAMRGVKDHAVIPALEAVAWSDSPKPGAAPGAASAFQTEAIALLGALPVQRATYSLTELSVLGKQSDLRSAAADQLRKRKLQDFVPILLNALVKPTEFEVTILPDPEAPMVTYSAIFSQEDQNSIHEVQIEDTGPTLICSNGRPSIALSSALSRHILARFPQYGRLVNATASHNRTLIELDRRIDRVLQCVTNLHPSDLNLRSGASDVIPDAAVASIESTPDYWWNWWNDYSETYKAPKPYRYDKYRWCECIPRTANDPTMSCFPAGARVWTATGPMAIEKIRIGDRVLAQDIESGELAYKPVLYTTLRPPADMYTMTTSKEVICSTRGHAFWATGKGWEMAKESTAGDRLYGLLGTATVVATGTRPPEPAYNLNVADFHTYFVGTSEQILVHDCSPRLPSDNVIPGYIARNP